MTPLATLATLAIVEPSRNGAHDSTVAVDSIFVTTNCPWREAMSNTKNKTIVSFTSTSFGN